jgi:hypothetical protein
VMCDLPAAYPPTLDLSNYKSHVPLKFLATLRPTTLDISCTKVNIDEISQTLTKMTGLASLTLRAIEVELDGPLPRLTAKALNSLANCTKLNKVTFWSFGSFEQFSILQTLNLQVLAVRPTPRPPREQSLFFRQVSQLRSLRKLDLHHLDAVNSDALFTLRSLPKLSSLALSIPISENLINILLESKLPLDLSVCDHFHQGINIINMLNTINKLGQLPVRSFYSTLCPPAIISAVAKWQQPPRDLGFCVGDFHNVSKQEMSLLASTATCLRFEDCQNLCLEHIQGISTSKTLTELAIIGCGLVDQVLQPLANCQSPVTKLELQENFLVPESHSSRSDLRHIVHFPLQQLGIVGNCEIGMRWRKSADLQKFALLRNVKLLEPRWQY